MSRNDRIIALIKSGASKLEVAERLGITRNTVAGVVWRAGIDTSDRTSKGKSRPRTPEGEARRIAAVRAHFQDPEFRKMHARACSEAQLRRLAEINA